MKNISNKLIEIIYFNSEIIKNISINTGERYRRNRQYNTPHMMMMMMMMVRYDQIVANLLVYGAPYRPFWE